MTPPGLDPATATAPAFRALHRRLLRRRLGDVEGVLRLELALLGLLLAGWLVLSIRPPLEDVAARGGPARVAAAMAAAGAGLALVAFVLVAARHARRLAAPGGPAWLALPLDAAAIGRHLAWESRFQAAWVAVPAASLVVAAAGLVPLPVLLALAAALAGLLLAAAHAGAAFGAWRAARAAAPRAGMPGLLRALTDVAPPRARPRLPRARWRRLPPWLALVLKDARATARRPELAQGLAVPLAFAAISLLGWLLPSEPGRVAGVPAQALDLRNLATFFVTLAAAATFAEWLVLVVGADPFAVVRALPLGLGAAWGARVAWALAFTALLLAGHGLLARGIAASPLVLFLSWVAGATLGLSILGVNYALSLYPRTAAARRLLGLTLALMAIVSTVLYLVGWVVLLAALVQTARRLPRWHRAVETEAA